MSRWIENAILTLLGVVALLFVVLSWDSGRRSKPPPNAASLTVISPHWEGIRHEFKRAFEAWWNGKHPDKPVTLTWLTPGGTSEIVRTIESDYAKHPEGINADVLFGGGVASHEYLSSKGLFERVNLPARIIRGIPPVIGGVRMYAKEHRWFGAAISGFGIVYNKEVLKLFDLTPPRDWEDLANPRYMGWVASGDPRSSGVVHMLYEVILQAYGFEKGYAIICGMAGNVRAFDEGGNATPRAVSLGEAAAGGSIDFYAFEQIATYGPENIGFVMPENLTVVSADPIAILKGTKNRELASAFVRFVLSEEGQKLWYVKLGEPGGPEVYGLNRFPVRSSLYGKGLPTAIKGNPYKFETKLRFDYEKSSARWRILNDLFKASIFDVHAELRPAWRIAGPSGDTALLVRYGQPPVTEDELIKLARTRWRNPSERARIMREWSAFAAEKFRAITEGR